MPACFWFFVEQSVCFTLDPWDVRTARGIKKLLSTGVNTDASTDTGVIDNTYVRVLIQV